MIAHSHAASGRQTAALGNGETRTVETCECGAVRVIDTEPTTTTPGGGFAFSWTETAWSHTRPELLAATLDGRGRRR